MKAGLWVAAAAVACIAVSAPTLASSPASSSGPSILAMLISLLAGDGSGNIPPTPDPPHKG